MKSQLDRIISIATLVALLVAIVLMLKKPAPVAHRRRSAAMPWRQPISPIARPVKQKADQPEPAAGQVQQTQTRRPSGRFFRSPPQQLSPVQNSPDAAEREVELRINSAGRNQLRRCQCCDQPVAGGEWSGADSGFEGRRWSATIKDQKVTYDGDMVHGQFLTEIGGKDVWITISGHMGQKDGYATFDPTEFKVGDLDVPVSLVNPALQRKLAEERDRLKISEPSEVENRIRDPVLRDSQRLLWHTSGRIL